ncbi:MAG: hypothetical protein IEMM0008_1869 [bacterium]|nr:MAG: hypothetical protein IEMM0008_1869 [bacterium]
MTIENERGFLYSKMVKTKSKTYFFDIKRNRNKKPILKIITRRGNKSSESHKSITLGEEEIDLVINALKEIKPIFQGI